ncbi:PepSY-associated TM helix domain-containing protein [uncultured Roseivirga sp.]|uniref:PepSY-associated TM helix domain-containing protein n=1 Tax=uncultured Roseivirga sp. TaxID=543088 RepID=UPI0030DDD058|tara:strand:- start:348436 stop:348972 length:537 start_codon:yes stop_codon:yes gene_type:complete
MAKAPVKLVKSIRSYRQIHKTLGLFIVLFLIISSITGLILGWKKNIDVLQPPTQSGETLNISEWHPVHRLAEVSLQAVDSLGLNASNFDRIEYRPTKGIAKVIFDTGSWEVQVDAKTLEVYSVAKRNSDWIEQIHDGSIISELFKLISMNVLGIGLLVLSISGIWLWYGPRKIRKLKS